MANRRNFLQSAFGLGASLLASNKLFASPSQSSAKKPKGSQSQQSGTAFNVPVSTPDVGDLPFTMDGEVKVFHLIAEPVKRQISPWKTLDCWGYNGSSPGPTIEANEGERVRVIVENHLPESTSMHWHGFEIPLQMDGMPYVSQKPIPPGGKFVYEFTLHQNGTYFYHSHGAMQEMMGMIGLFILHPKTPYQPHVDHDFGVVLQEWALLPNQTVPNSANMEYNWLTLNGKAAPSTTPLLVRQGSRVRIRIANIGMDHHPIHLHGHTFQVTGTEGGRIPEAAWWPGNTVLVGVAQARNIEFIANNPGDWMLHCHLPHHMMNQMSSNVGKMTRTTGMPTGGDMNTGMGMLQGTPGAPLGDDYGPTLGRGLGGVGNASDTPSTNGPLSQEKEMSATPGMQDMSNMQMDIAPNANDVPNFPQDAYMEGPMMTMDAARSCSSCRPFQLSHSRQSRIRRTVIIGNLRHSVRRCRWTQA